MTPTSHAAQAGIDLDKLEALARAADAEAHERGEWFNVYQLADGITLDASAALMGAANPAIVLDLIALARNAACAAQDARQSVNPAAQAVDARADFVLVPVDPPLAMAKAFRDHDLNGDRFLDGYAAMLAASPAPETAQADDIGDDEVAIPADMTETDYWRRRAKAAQAIARGFKRRFEAATAHAQQDAALADIRNIADELEAEALNYEGDFADTVKGCAEALYQIADRIPSAVTGKAAAANAGDPNELHFNSTRLRNVARLVGMENAVPEDDETLDGARGSVLGLIAGKLHTMLATSAADAKDAEPIAFPVPLKEVDVLVDGKIVSTTPVGDYFSHSGVVAYSRAAIAASQKGTEA